MANDNVMRKLKIEKVTVNVGVGASGDVLDKAKKLLQKLTGKLPVLTNARRREQSFGIRKGDAIGTKVTMRGKDAEEFLGKAFETIDEKISKRAFDKFGNFSFGIKEYIDFPGMRYDPSIGLIGFDVCVTVNRPGARIAERKRKRAKLPNCQRGTKEESIAFITEKYKITVIES
jgi:large subunit ribosomal protein L5